MNGPKSTDEGSHQFRLSRKWQWILLVPITLHAMAVFSEPFHFFSRSPVQAAADADWLRNSLRPYSQWMFLDHGYFFFAPNPGPGHVLRAVASDNPLVSPNSPDEIWIRDGHLYPDRNEHKPRLLYHRYFMLSEFYHSRYAPYEITPELQADAEFLSTWQSDRRIYRAMQDSISEYIQRITNQPYVRLDRLERALPDRDSILHKNIRISDPRWLSILPESMLRDPIRSTNNPVPASEELVLPQADRRP